MSNLQAYGRINFKRARLLPMSRLYSLEPVGVATPMVECLTGYIARLAAAHSVMAGMIVGWEIAPLVGKRYMLKIAPVLKGGILGKPLRNLVKAANGTGATAARWAAALERLTLRSGMRFLTILPWADAFSEQHLMRHGRAWCPVCYEEWRMSGIIYEPLLWTLEVVKVCPRHALRLQTECRRCGAGQLPVLASGTRPGRCSRCREWLGSTPSDLASDPAGLEETDLEWDLFVARSVGEFLAAGPHLTSPSSCLQVAQSMSACVRIAARDSITECARRARIPMSTLRNWRNGRSATRLDLMLRLCHSMRVSPLDFTLGRIGQPGYSLPSPPQTNDSRVNRSGESFDPEAVRTALLKSLREDNPPLSFNQFLNQLGQDRKKVRRRFTDLCEKFDARYNAYRREYWKGVGRSMEKSLAENPPPSIAELTRRLGHSKSTLYIRLRLLCHRASARYSAYVKERRERSRELLREEVRHAVLKLHGEGDYPSYRAVSRLLSSPGRLSLPHARAALTEAKLRLGLIPRRKGKRR